MIGALLIAAAIAPRAGQGDVALLGGLRLAPTSALSARAEKGGDPLSDSGGVSATALAVFAYHLDGDWVAALEIGGTMDGVRRASGGTTDWTTVTLQFAMQREWRPLPWLSPFAGGGAGYYLNSMRSTGDGVPPIVEHHTAGLFLSVGARVALGGPLGLYVEDRYQFATLPMAKLGRVHIGGNIVSLGLSWTMEE